MTNSNKPSMSNVPAEILEMGFDPNTMPPLSELTAIPREQSKTITQIMSSGERTIIDLGWIGKLTVFWMINHRGLTVGGRLYIFGRKYEIGSAPINPRNPRIIIEGPKISGYQATLTAGVNTSKAQLYVEATMQTGWPFYETFKGKLAISYANPWPQLELGMVAAEQITGDMARNINTAPRFSSQHPVPGFLQNDQFTRTMLEVIMWLTGAGNYVSHVRRAAQHMETNNLSLQPKDLVLAIGLSVGAGAGVDKVLGIYITGDGELGWFGKTSINAGLLLGISASLPFYIFWSGKAGFSSVIIGITLGVGKSLGPKFPAGAGVKVSLYWSNSWSRPQPHPTFSSGFCVAPSIGVGSPVPVQAYVSFGKTYTGKLADVWKEPARELAYKQIVTSKNEFLLDHNKG